MTVSAQSRTGLLHHPHATEIGEHVEEGGGKTEKNGMKRCSLEKLLPLHTGAHCGSSYTPEVKPVKMATEMGRSYQVTTSSGAAGSWWWFPGDREALFHKVWPLVGKSCSRGDRTLMHMWTSLTGLSGLFGNNGEQLWKKTVWCGQESLQGMDII